MKIKEAFDAQRNAYHKAFQGSASRSDTPDPDVQNYEKLQPQHFDVMVQKFGLDKTSAYIKEMELKRMNLKQGLLPVKEG